MTNLIKIINTYIKDNISNTVIYNDVFPEANTEGVIARHDPATRKAVEFIDGTAELQINISYYARYKNAETSRAKLTAILDLLEGARLRNNTDNVIIKLSTVSNVQFTSVDEKNNSIYTCSVNATYTTF